MTVVNTVGSAEARFSFYPGKNTYDAWFPKVTAVNYYNRLCLFLNEDYVYNAAHTMADINKYVIAARSARETYTQHPYNAADTAVYAPNLSYLSFNAANTYFYFNFRFRYFVWCDYPEILDSPPYTMNYHDSSRTTPLAIYDFGQAIEAQPGSTAGGFWSLLQGTFMRLRSDNKTIQKVAGDTTLDVTAPNGTVKGFQISRGPTTSSTSSTGIAYGSADLIQFPPVQMHADAFTGALDSFPLLGTQTGDMQTDPVRAVLDTPSALQISKPSALNDRRPAPILRTFESTVINLEEPAIVNGLPCSPAYYARMDSTASVQDIVLSDDLDPVYDTGSGAWTVAPPTGGVGDYWWKASSLPASPNGHRLGDPSTIDLTNVQPSGYNQWNESPHPNSQNKALKSFYPFKPQVLDYRHYIDGDSFVAGRTVQFSRITVDHMFSDVTLTPPYTFIMVAMPLVYNTNARLIHTLWSAGKDIRTLGYTNTNTDTATNGFLVTNEIEEVGSGNVFAALNQGMKVTQTDQSLVDGNESFSISIPGGPKTYIYPRQIPCAHDSFLRPRMYVGVWNGTNSFVGNYSSKGTNGNIGTSINDAVHGFVIGRRGGEIMPVTASSMLVWEVRIWNQALPFSTIQAQYNQLSATHNFAAYG